MFRSLVDRILSELHKTRLRTSSATAGRALCKDNRVNKQHIKTFSFLSSKPYQRKNGMATFENLKFDNSALRSLPVESEEKNYVRQVAGACFSRVKPTPVENPVMVAYSKSAMELLDLGEDQLERPEAVDYFSGNAILKGSETAAHCYCGHQFGHFSGQLGDGAAMYLGEVVNKKGERWEIQLKGAGPTPYSRSADGRKVLRSTVREFLCSEAMHFLGIPTTRAGTCVTSDSTVVRDIFYSGNPINEKCTLVLRIARTFLRFGSFEIFKPMDGVTGRKGPSVGRSDILTQMLDYTIETFYPQIWEAHGADKQTAYLEFYREIVLRTARLVAAWQCVGFCHGVLNTDNMSAVGVTIDYGPYGFMDAYDPGYICNGSDDGGRYAYDQQPEICKWNCLKLAEAIHMAVSLSMTTPVLDSFMEEYDKHYLEKMRKKLGLIKKVNDADKELVVSFLDTMHKTSADFTNTFRCLSGIPLPGCAEHEQKKAEVLQYILSQCSTIAEMRKAVSKPRMDPRQFQMFVMILQSNPELLSQLGGAQRSILQELQRIEKVKELQGVNEDNQRENNEKLWKSWLSGYCDRLKLEAEGEDCEEVNRQRVAVMDSTNPRFVLRNYIAQNAITAAEAGDFSEVRRVLRLLENPFSKTSPLGERDVSSGQASASMDDDTVSASAAEGESMAGNSASCASGVMDVAYDSKPPDWSRELRVT